MHFSLFLQLIFMSVMYFQLLFAITFVYLFPFLEYIADFTAITIVIPEICHAYLTAKNRGHKQKKELLSFLSS